MRKQQRFSWMVLVLFLLAGSGCCCVQGTAPCGSCGPCGGGACGVGPLLGYRACAGGCGQTYVDEWVSEPPCIDKCCAGNPMPVRSLLRTLWGSRFVQGCDMCSTGCDSCSSGEACGCGYASAGGSGCTGGGCSSCGGGGVVSGEYIGGHAGGHSGTCSSCAGGATVTEPMMPSVSNHMPAHEHTAQANGNGAQPRMVPGSFKISAPRKVPASVASERINPARQKIDAKRASYTN